MGAGGGMVRSSQRDARSSSLQRMVIERVRQAQTLRAWLGWGVKEGGCHGFGGWEIAGL